MYEDLLVDLVEIESEIGVRNRGFMINYIMKKDFH
jgi:hypothetical protein